MLYIKMLAEGGAAESEGIKVGDRVLEINRDPTEGESQFISFS